MAIENHTKVCKQCGEDKPLTEFRPNKKWLRCECRNCERANVRKHHAKFRAERTPEQKKADAEYQRRYKTENRQRRTAWEREWRKRNPEKAKLRSERYVAKHPEVVVTRVERRRARLVNAPLNDFTIHQWRVILEAFNYHCAYCLTPSKGLHQEHIIPLSRGGSHTATNIVPACARCNRQKHTKTLLEFVMAQSSVT